MASSLSQPYFTPFKNSVSEYSLPERFTFPFYYQPDALSLLAAKELQHYLASQNDWQYNFGLDGDQANASGKMFGVLVVKNQQGDLGYLSAFSGKLADQHLLANFVPPVFDILSTEDFFLLEQKAINQLNLQIEILLARPQLQDVQNVLAERLKQSQDEISQYQDKIVLARKERKAKRVAGSVNLTEQALITLNQELAGQSIWYKKQLIELKESWQNKLAQVQQQVNGFLSEIEQLKAQRKTRSNVLQHKLFSQYRFLNCLAEEKDLVDIFKNTPRQIPPSGAGDCAAPKLLQYAFKHKLSPISLAEFWWGISPKSEIRQHKNFYPSCLGKCQPILSHMLVGMTIDDNPLLKNPALGKDLKIIYQDEAIVIVNKPAEFLSVPGKHISDSVLTRMQKMFPQAKSPFIVHRLDMSTSGLMVIALSNRAHKSLQKQFINRSIEKRYTALVQGVLTEKNGVINLPLRGDIDDRPRQLVCLEYGKAAETSWQVLANDPLLNQTKLALFPKTGRTHQLRVHCAHHRGLHMPIVGDDLYGQKAQRLHLHAEFLALNHPLTKKRMEFEVLADF